METGVGFINLDDSVKIALNIALAVARENANECYTPVSYTHLTLPTIA